MAGRRSGEGSRRGGAQWQSMLLGPENSQEGWEPGRGRGLRVARHAAVAAQGAGWRLQLPHTNFLPPAWEAVVPQGGTREVQNQMGEAHGARGRVVAAWPEGGSGGHRHMQAPLPSIPVSRRRCGVDQQVVGRAHRPAPGAAGDGGGAHRAGCGVLGGGRCRHMQTPLPSLFLGAGGGARWSGRGQVDVQGCTRGRGAPWGQTLWGEHLGPETEWQQQGRWVATLCP